MNDSTVKSQGMWSLGYTLFLILLIVLFMQMNFSIALIFILGIGLGFTLQKSRFCFVSALRDPILLGMIQLTKALILLLILSILGFASVIWITGKMHTHILLNVYPLGIHIIVGGILFGIGMVIAGGCTSGTLMRIGEGFAMQMVAFLGILIGALIGQKTQYQWKLFFGEWKGVFLPKQIGWFPALTLEIIFLIMLWLFLNKWQKRKSE